MRWWPNSNHIIHSCATAALARGYRIFSIQDFGDCRWGPNAERDYAKYGHGFYCYQGLGWIGSGSVYRVQNLAPGSLFCYGVGNWHPEVLAKDNIKESEMCSPHHSINLLETAKAKRLVTQGYNSSHRKRGHLTQRRRQTSSSCPRLFSLKLGLVLGQSNFP